MNTRYIVRVISETDPEHCVQEIDITAAVQAEINAYPGDALEPQTIAWGLWHNYREMFPHSDVNMVERAGPIAA